MLSLLRRRDFGLLWTAGLVSVAGNFTLFVALPLYAYDLTGSALATGGVFAASVVPRILLGSIAGVFVDRWDRKRTMIRADLLRALLLPLLAVDSPDLLWLLFLVRAAVASLGLFFEPAENALLPRLVGPERLVEANALNALNNNLGRLAGPALGGLLYAWGGLTWVTLVDVASFLASAALIALIRADGRPERDPARARDPGGVFGEWVAGLRLVRHGRALGVIFLAFSLGFVAEGTFGVGFAPLTLDVLHGGAGGAGLLMSAQAVGGLLAGATTARAAGWLPPRRMFAGGLIGLGLTDLGFANAANLAEPGPRAVAVAAVFMFLAGFPVVALNAAGTGLLQTLTVDAFRGRVFGALGAAEGVAMLAGIAVGGPAVETFGVVPVMSAGAAMWVAGGVAAVAMLPAESSSRGVEGSRRTSQETEVRSQGSRDGSREVAEIGERERGSEAP